MNRRFSVFLFSLLGAFAIHGALVACSAGGGGRAPGDVEGTAHAADPQPPAAAPCTAWQTKAFLPKTFAFRRVPITNSDGTTGYISLPVADGLDLPEGWEPFAGEAYGAVLARHCVAP